MTNMRREKTQLLCTFSNPKRLKKTLDEIVENYDVFQNKVYIFEDEKNKNLMLTYNIVLKENAERKKHLPRTIIVQRKKESNTLYTINALNQLIYFLNDGKLDKNYEIPWENYRNTALIITQNGFEALKLRLLEIKKLGDRKNERRNERKTIVSRTHSEKRGIVEKTNKIGRT